MPELPEVETVKNSLCQQMRSGSKITGWKFHRRDLRNAIPIKELNELVGAIIVSFERRAKYILINANKNGEDFVIISHLGMTGQWRIEKNYIGKKKKHDHVIMIVNHNNYLVYSDPRRFGFIELHEKIDIKRRFQGMGFEPFDSKLDSRLFADIFKKLKVEVKQALLNQKYVVGIGNIYASEVLFRAGVSPIRKCNQISDWEFAKILKECRIVLKAAIRSGGSTIANYKNSYGQQGSFQNKFLVYGRKGETCLRCRSKKIQSQAQGGRSTFWCSKCQK
jgi:formamidopyrimidine-DNA glycosylase